MIAPDGRRVRAVNIRTEAGTVHTEYRVGDERYYSLEALAEEVEL
jgi:hypothetical protein